MKDKKWIWMLVFVALIALTVVTITTQSKSFTAEGFAEYVAAANPKWLLLAVLGALNNILFEGLAILCLLDMFGYRRSLGRGVLYSASDLYFSAITPSATGGQPASAYCMMRDRVPGVVTTVTLLMNLALYTLSILVIALLCVLVRPGLFLDFSPLCKALILIGAGTQLLLFTGFLLLIFRERILMKLVDLGIRLFGRLRLMRNAEAKRAHLVELQQDLRACADVLHRHRGKLAAAFAMNFIQRLSLVAIPAFVHMAAGGESGKIVDILAAQGFVVLGSNSIPIPGAVGVADLLFLDGFRNLIGDPVNLELLSRSISFYGCILLCGIILLANLLHGKRKNTGG